MTQHLSTQTWAVTGSSGRLGTYLRKELAGQVRSLVLVDRAIQSPLNEGEVSFSAALDDPVKLRQAFEGVDGVIHLAGIADEADVRELVETNILGSFHVLEAARQSGVRRVVLASTGRTIGMYDVQVRVDETMPPRPDGFYSWTKVAIEGLGRLYSEKFGLEVASVRLGLMGEAPTDQRAMSVWVSPRDAVSAFIALAKADLPGYVNMFGYSANEYLWVDSSQNELLGYRPVDNASEHRDSLTDGSKGPVPNGPQGGFRATAEHSLKFLKPLR